MSCQRLKNWIITRKYSILVISQIPVASWYDMFLEHTYAEACLARLLSDAYRLEMNGRNMRNIEPINKQP